MLDILSNLIRWLAEPAEIETSRADPLSHPALEAMNERELADLPFTPSDDHFQSCAA